MLGNEGLASFAFLYALSVVPRHLIVAASPDPLSSHGMVRSRELSVSPAADAMPRQDLERVCWYLLKLGKNGTAASSGLHPIFFWQMEGIHLLSPSYSEISKLCLFCRNVRAQEFQCAACWKALLAHGQQRGTGLAMMAGGREMKGIFYNTLGSIRRMLCLAWTGLTWCIGFFSYNAGKIAIKEIQR